MTAAERTIEISVTLTNPGHFFACCGALELADRLWGGAEGWFGPRRFHVRPAVDRRSPAIDKLFEAVRACRLTNTMTDAQVRRLEELSAMTARQRAQIAGLDEEKKGLEKLRREEPIVLHAPFNIRIDWFLDDPSLRCSAA